MYFIFVWWSCKLQWNVTFSLINYQEENLKMNTNSSTFLTKQQSNRLYSKYEYIILELIPSYIFIIFKGYSEFFFFIYSSTFTLRLILLLICLFSSFFILIKKQNQKTIVLADQMYNMFSKVSLLEWRKMEKKANKK
jgi:uncharacterized membrane protein